MSHVVYVLGSAQDGGLPQFGARQGQDAAARNTPALRRLGPSLCVLGQGKALLVDVSPDIKEQEQRLWATPEYAARNAATPFDALLLTHAHIGHYAGLIHFGREAANTRQTPCYVSASMARFLSTNGPWEQLVRLNNLKLIEIIPGKPFSPWPGLEITAFLVPHRGEYTDTLGLSFNGHLLYVPDIDDWKPWAHARREVERHETNLLDATFFSNDELSGRDIAEVPHPRVTDTLDFFGDLAGKALGEGRKRRIILTHLNHTNPLCHPESDAARHVNEAGFEVAHEMMRLELPPPPPAASAVTVPDNFNAVVLTFGPRVDAATLPALRGAADRSGVPEINAHRILHARQVTQIDSSAIAGLFDLIERVVKGGFEVILCDPPPALQRYLEVYRTQEALKNRVCFADARGRYHCPLVDFIPPFVPAPQGRVDIYRRGRVQSFSFGRHELEPAPPVDLGKAVLAAPDWLSSGAVHASK